jgi:hypothetical protein
LWLASCGLIAGLVSVQDVRGDYPVRRGEQRNDYWSRPSHNGWVPYRKEMNRPRFITGYVLSKIEPTSQEAMSWEEHHAEGAYRNHRPGYVKTYYYPKPWEVLPIDPRPAKPLEGETAK